MKRLFSLLLVLVLCAALALPAFAADLPRFADTASLVTDAEAQALNEKLDAMSQQQNFDFAIVTMPTLNGNDPGQTAAWVYDNYGYGAGINGDGVLLLISMAERDWYICCGGSGNEIINADARDYISQAMLPDLSAGNYTRAFNTFADESNAMYELAKSGKIYRAPFPFAIRFFVSLAISLVVALISVGVMKSKLKTVAKQTAAASYVVPGSLNIDQSSERYLYSNVTRTQRVQNNVSSGGPRGGSGGHSGSGGKF